MGQGMLSDVVSQSNVDADLVPQMGQFDHAPFEKSADSNRPNFGLYEADHNAL